MELLFSKILELLFCYTGIDLFLRFKYRVCHSALSVDFFQIGFDIFYACLLFHFRCKIATY